MLDKVCKRCEERKPTGQFYVHKQGYILSWCKACSIARNKELRADPERVVKRRVPVRPKACSDAWSKEYYEQVREIMPNLQERWDKLMGRLRTN